MADLATHFGLTYAVARPFERHVRAAFLLGAFLPDLLYKTALYLLGASTWFCEPTHSPLTLILAVYAASLLFEERQRRGVFFAMLAGSWLHVLVDAGKSYTGEGVVLWAFPFSMNRFEFGCYDPEETLYLAGPAVAIGLIAELIARVSPRSRTTTP